MRSVNACHVVKQNGNQFHVKFILTGYCLSSMIKVKRNIYFISNYLHIPSCTSSMLLQSCMDEHSYLAERNQSHQAIWGKINAHGKPTKVSAHLEFYNITFAEALQYLSVFLEPRPATRHEKIGLEKRKNCVIRVLCQSLKKDARFFYTTYRNKLQSITVHKILSCATYLTNIQYSSKVVISFETALGYTTPILCSSSTKLSDDLPIAKKAKLLEERCETW